jgi:hypothetical protein
MQQMRGANGKFGEAPKDQRTMMAEFIAKQKKMMLSPYVANPQELPNKASMML